MSVGAWFEPTIWDFPGLPARPHNGREARGMGMKTFDADNFLDRFENAVVDYHENGTNEAGYLAIKAAYVAELRAAMGGRGDEGKPGNKLCESGESPATHRDIDDVPLCKACYDELPAAPGERSGE